MTTNPSAPGVSAAPRVEDTAATDALSIALGSALRSRSHACRDARPWSRRVVFIAMIAMAIAVMSALIAQVLTALIGIVTKLAFHGRWSTAFVSSAENVGRAIVVDATSPQRVIGILTRGDLLAAHAKRLRGANDRGRHLRVRHARKTLRRGG